MSKRRFIAVLLLVVGAVVSGFSFYPVKDIKHIMPWGAGGGTDVVMRYFMSLAEKILGVTIYTVNIPGAMSGLGVRELMFSAPDGYTIGTLTWDSFVTVPWYRLIPDYDLARLELICTVTEHPSLLAVHRDAPWQSIEELLEDARTRPGKITVANVGTGGVWHLPVLDLERKAGVKFSHVAFPGGAAEEREALIKREVDVACISYAGILPALLAGDARVLLVFSKERFPALPEVPTAVELGYEECIWGSMRVIAVPKGVAENIIAYLEEVFRQVAFSEAWQTWLARSEGVGAWIWRGRQETKVFIETITQKAWQLMDELEAAGLLKKG